MMTTDMEELFNWQRAIDTMDSKFVPKSVRPGDKFQIVQVDLSAGPINGRVGDIIKYTPKHFDTDRVHFTNITGSEDMLYWYEVKVYDE